MKGIGSGIVIGFAIAAALAGACHDGNGTASSSTVAVCSVLCQCTSLTKLDPATCETQCESQATFTAACEDCVFTHDTTCGGLAAACNSACQMGPTTGGGGGGSATARSAACDLLCACTTGASSGSAFDSCNSTCLANASASCVACANADGTCSATSTCGC